MQVLVRPVIPAAAGFTVIGEDVLQPLPPMVYVIVGVLTKYPDTTPDAKSTLACAILLLLHVPPPVASDNVVVPPTHTPANVPEMGAGRGFTVTVTDFVHPPVRV